MASEAIELPKRPTDCKSPEGILVGLIDSILTAATVAASRMREIDPDDVPEGALEACIDLFGDADLRFLISFGGNRQYGNESLVAEMRAENERLTECLEHANAALTAGDNSRQAVLTEALKAVRGVSSNYGALVYRSDCESAVSRLLEVGKAHVIDVTINIREACVQADCSCGWRVRFAPNSPRSQAMGEQVAMEHRETSK